MIVTTEAYQKVAKTLQWFLDIFSTGCQNLQKFFNDIWKEIEEWFLKNKKAYPRKISETSQYHC